MAALNVIDYTPAPTVKAFIKDYIPGGLFYNWIVGPVGSGKTTGLFFKLVHMAMLQKPQADGIRRTKAVIVRNTAPQLNDTTIASWHLWFKDGQAGVWKATSKNFILRFGDVECEVLFRPLDTPEDIGRVLSLDVTFVIIDEFIQIPRAVVDALSARCGRYPTKKDGGATNWGMWGSSNPSTEDNWWFDFLHTNPWVLKILRGESQADQDVRRADQTKIVRELPGSKGDETISIKYFLQPSGFAPDAENLDGLPPYIAGDHSYYTNQAKGKSDVWIKQFLEAEWGFSIAGKPVVESFRAALHVSKSPLRFNPALPLVIGFDPGLAGSALVFGQQDLYGRLLIFGELIQENMGPRRIIRERLKPYLRRRFPDARVIIAPDPAASNRSGDEVEIIKPFKDAYTVVSEGNNRLPLRLNALDHFCTTLVEGMSALQIDEKECPTVVRALKGGWRYAMDTKKDAIKGTDPEKNPYSHAGDATGYLARYFHKLTERELRYGPGAVKPFVPPRKFGPGYHQV